MIFGYRRERWKRRKKKRGHEYVSGRPNRSTGLSPPMLRNVSRLGLANFFTKTNNMSWEIRPTKRRSNESQNTALEQNRCNVPARWKPAGAVRRRSVECHQIFL